MEAGSFSFANQGDPSLLIFRCPEEISQSGSEVECFAFAVQPRVGGLLLCLPRNVVSEEALIAALSAEDDSMLGPSKLIRVQLCEEVDDGSTATVPGPPHHVYLIDFNDEIMAYLQEYDPALHSENQVFPFSAENPGAVPVASAVVELAGSWIADQGFPRANFYSAREEQEEPEPKAPSKATSKKAPAPKRISNAQVMDQLAMLATQIQALAVRQEEAEKNYAKGAPGVLQAERAFGSTQPVPAVSAGLGAKAVPPALGAVSKALELAGPPPRTRTTSMPLKPPEEVQEEVEDPFRDPIERSLSSRWHRSSSGSAVNSHNNTCGTLSKSGRSVGRAWINSCQFFFHQRSSKKGAPPERDSLSLEHLLFAGDAASSPPTTPWETNTEDRSRSSWPFVSDLPREERRISAEPRCWFADVAHGPHHGGGGSRRRLADEREVGSSCGGFRSVSGRPGGLDAGVFTQPGRRPPYLDVSGQNQHHCSLRQTVLDVGASYLVGNLPGLCKRTGDIDHPQTRGIPEEEQGCQDRRCRRASIAQAKGQVSQETQGRPAGSVEGRSSMHEVNQVFDFDLAKPCDHHHTVPPGPCRVCHDDHKKSTKVRRPLDGDVSMHVWCGHLLRAVMKTRTPFSEFVRRCNHLQRSDIVSSSPAMPLPLPFLLDFEAMPSGLSCKKRSKLYFRRAINVVVLALNFWWADFKFVDVEMMRRTPSWQQRLIYNRIASLLRVDGPRQLTSLVSGAEECLNYVHALVSYRKHSPLLGQVLITTLALFLEEKYQ